MYDFKFISESKIKEDIEIFKEYGLIAAITDYAILLGGEVSSSNFTKDNRKSGFWWTSSINNKPSSKLDFSSLSI